MRRELERGAALYNAFRGFEPTMIRHIQHRRLMPPVVIDLGELAGLIYRTDKANPGERRTFVHFLENPPRLVSDVAGTQLYIVNGRYRVTANGIEG